jgi:hypothetical protein
MSKNLWLALVLAVTGMAQPPAQTVRVMPSDTGEALVNPGMGWALHHYDNDLVHYGLELQPSDTVDDFPGASVVYLRLAWSYVEPEEGRFNWSVVDTPAQRWIAKGKKVAFRFSCSESDPQQPYATPEWVRKAGAKGYFFVPGEGVSANGKNWEPDFDDAVFLAKLDAFLAAAGARYDGNPEVAFIDLGSFGVWGEGHTFWSTRIPYSAATLRRHIDLYRKHFPHTVVAVNDDFAGQGRGREVIGYGRDARMTLRDDSILVEPGALAYKSASMAPDFWPTVPVILEMEHFGPSRDRGVWGDGGKYLEAVEAYHASYVTVHWYPREFLAANRELVARINRRLGYRLQLVEASWPAEVHAGTIFPLSYKLRNGGVAPCLPGGRPAITLKDAKGGIAGVFADDEFDVREMPVGAPGQAESRPRQVDFRIPPANILKPGEYSVYFSVGSATGTPQISLPLAAGDGERRYQLGMIRVIE